MKIELNRFTFLLISLFGIAVSSLAYFILPARFFFDTHIYINDPGNEIGFKGSYPLTILFYNITGLKYLHFSIIGVIQYSVLALMLYKIGIPKRFGYISIKNILVYFGFLMMAIFIAMPTKEFLNFLFVGGIVFLFKNRKYSLRKTIFIATLMLVIYSVFFRQYYIFVAALPFVMYTVAKIKIKNKRILSITTGVLVIIILSLSYGVVKGKFMSEEIRYGVNATRMNSENANSMIVSPIKPDSWYGESIGILYGFFSVNLPLNGVKYLKSPHIMAFVLWQLVMFAVFYKKYNNSMYEGRKENYELWLFYMMFSFFIVQGVFEPDLGSAIRHKTGIFPLIYYLFYYEDFRKKLR